MKQVYKQFQGVKKPDPKDRTIRPETKTEKREKLLESLEAVFDRIPITDGMTLSFHHHFQNNDTLINAVAEVIQKRDIKNLTLAATAIHAVHAPLVPLLENNNIVKIHATYINGPVGIAISKGKLQDFVTMTSHGRRQQAVECGDLSIDVAFLAVPFADIYGNGNGIEGKHPCGVLAYAISDMMYAKHKIVVTDTLVEHVKFKEIEAEYIDYVVKIDTLSTSEDVLPKRIKLSSNPIDRQIGKNTFRVIDALDLIKPDMACQVRAGGIPLIALNYLKNALVRRNIQAKFVAGGTTYIHKEMLEKGLVKTLYDVQTFDMEALESYKTHGDHYGLNASLYANPYDEHAIAHQLDFVVLGAVEVDLSYNVNLTTDKDGIIIGGSGGHQDTAFGANVTIIAAPLFHARMPLIKDRLHTTTTPGETIDIIVTERGIAVNPLRKDIIETLSRRGIEVSTIHHLHRVASRLTGIPVDHAHEGKIVGIMEYRDGSVLDTIHAKEEE